MTHGGHVNPGDAQRQREVGDGGARARVRRCAAPLPVAWAGVALARSWKEHLLFIYDSTVNKKESDPPEDAILVFLAPVEVELRTQVGALNGQGVRVRALSRRRGCS